MPITIDIPGKIIAVGLNYVDHAKEARAPIPREPMIFAHWPNALIGPGDPIRLPDPGIDWRIDYEGELAVVIGREGKNVDAADALDYVRGYCCFNDVSARGLYDPDSGGQLTLTKSLDTFDPVGEMTAAEAIADPQALRIRTILNGEVMQDGSTGDMIFSVAQLIAYLSRTVTLCPGDLLATGTPAGVGVVRDPPVFLTDGDEVTVEIEGLVPLTNPVRAAKL